MSDEIITGAAAALGLSGEFRMVGDARVYVLNGLSWRRWGEYLFDPLGNGEHAFGIAGALEMTVGFGATCAVVQGAGFDVLATETYSAHAGDRFVAARYAIARCAGLIRAAKMQHAAQPRAVH